MIIPRDRINSAAIRSEMERDHYATAEFLGTYSHPSHPNSRDWEITLYRAADALVAETNGDPVWEHSPDFDQLLAEYSINPATL